MDISIKIKNRIIGDVIRSIRGEAKDLLETSDDVKNDPSMCDKWKKSFTQDIAVRAEELNKLADQIEERGL